MRPDQIDFVFGMLNAILANQASSRWCRFTMNIAAMFWFAAMFIDLYKENLL